jgi:hypothetical protein
MIGQLCGSPWLGISCKDGRDQSAPAEATVRIRTPFFLFLGIIACAQAGTAAGPAKPLSLRPVTALFRCPDTLDCVAPDRIQADGLGSYRGASVAPEQGPYFDSTGNFYFPLQPGLGRFVALDFSEPLGTPACAAKATCRKNFAAVLTDNSLPASIVNPLDAAGSSLPNGFLSIAVGQSARARYKLNFRDPDGRSLLWTVRFNSAMYPGSTELTVTRVDVNSWIVEAGASDVAELVATTTSGRSITTSEGYYSMPFRITVIR